MRGLDSDAKIRHCAELPGGPREPCTMRYPSQTKVSEEDFYYFTGASLVMTSTYAKAALDCQFTRNIPLSSER